jgi:hypothetical protein
MKWSLSIHYFPFLVTLLVFCLCCDSSQQCLATCCLTRDAYQVLRVAFQEGGRAREDILIGHE